VVGGCVDVGDGGSGVVDAANEDWGVSMMTAMVLLQDGVFWAIVSGVLLIWAWSIRLGMLFWVPMRRSAEAARSWLLLVFFLPTVGVILYWLIGRAEMPRWRRRRIRQLQHRLEPLSERILGRPEIRGEDVDAAVLPAAQLASRLGRLPILDGNRVELLSDYRGALARLSEDIDRAEGHVHLLYYILGSDEWTRPIIDSVLRAARRGVHCRILVDAYGSRQLIAKLREDLRSGGERVEVRQVLQTGLFSRSGIRGDLRNHRKLAVIDGRVGYTGSQNLIRADFRPGVQYEELVVRISGPVVLELQYVFCCDWLLETDEMLDGPEFFPEPVLAGGMAAQVLPSGPSWTPLCVQRIVVQLIHLAQRRVVVTTPYFIPDESLLQALQTAALRGVEVRLLVSEEEEQVLVSRAQQSWYEELLECGVRIHLFRRHFLHSKHITIDDRVSVVGSCNMDIRSFVLNAEVSLLIYDSELTRELQRVQAADLSRSRELGLLEWRGRGAAARFVQNLCRLLSPVL
jgi:cardiolipin synthase